MLHAQAHFQNEGLGTPAPYQTWDTLCVPQTKEAGWDTLYALPNRDILPFWSDPLPPVGTMSQLLDFLFLMATLSHTFGTYIS